MLKLQAKGAAFRADEHHWTVHCVRSSEWSTFHLHLFISYQCILGWRHLQKPSPKCNFTYIFLLFLFCSGAPKTLLTGSDCWSAHRSPAACDSFKRVHDWCKAVWRRPGAPLTKILATPVTMSSLRLMHLFMKCYIYKLLDGCPFNGPLSGTKYPTRAAPPIKNASTPKSSLPFSKHRSCALVLVEHCTEFRTSFISN